ncbi:MAG: prefoldin subunit alpha, partial [Candidatus Thermoplasmatota archaeon]|nr:prefoldin subunit alpha [Candidatus Thermoplasmatota archaeon]
MANQADLQQQVQVAESIQNQLQQLQTQYEQISQYMGELTETQEAIEELASQSAGETVMVPVGSGAFVRATLAEPDKVLAPLGSGVLAEEEHGQAVKRLEARRAEAKQAQEELTQYMDRLEGQLDELVGQLRQAQAGMAQQ